MRVLKTTELQCASGGDTYADNGYACVQIEPGLYHVAPGALMDGAALAIGFAVTAWTATVNQFKSMVSGAEGQYYNVTVTIDGVDFSDPFGL